MPISYFAIDVDAEFRYFFLLCSLMAIADVFDFLFRQPMLYCAPICY